MPQTVAQLGARALRKLGVAIVANAVRPAAVAAVTSDDVTARVLRELGILVPDADRPTAQPAVTKTEVAIRALRSVGVNPAGSGGAPIDAVTVSAAADIAILVLRKLEVIASDETASTNDLNSAVVKVNAVHAHLAAMDLVTWTVDQVPQRAVEFYVIMASALLAPEFGKAGSEQAFSAAQSALGMQQLSGPSGQAIAENKVASVHDTFLAQGIADWTTSTIPAAYAEDYATMTAMLLRKAVGREQDAPSRQVDAAEWDAALERVRKGQAVKGAQARAAQRVAAVHEELNASSLVTWGVDAIPAAAADAYAAMAAAIMAPEFGKPFDAQAYALNGARVRRIAMGGPAGQALAEQKVKAVHASQAAARRTRWTLHDLPVAAEEPYVLMAAYLLAPEVDAKADPAWWAQGEADLCRLVALPSDGRPVSVDYF